MRKLLVVTTMCLLAGAASAAELTETIDRTIEVKAGGSVELSNVNGRVVIGSWDQPRVRVVARKQVNGDRDDIKDALKELRVEIQPKNGGVVISTHYPKRDEGVASIFDWLLGDHVEAQVRYDITVPRAMNVDATTVNGAIELSGVNGKLELETTNGRIEVANCAGSLEASTTNGGIHAELVRLAKGQPLSFETTNGRIELTVPSDAAAEIDASTTNGSIHSDLPVATTRISRNSLRGTINGGGTQLRLRTTNGGIDIRTVGKS
jgi:hypothetical protein